MSKPQAQCFLGVFGSVFKSCGNFSETSLTSNPPVHFNPNALLVGRLFTSTANWNRNQDFSITLNHLEKRNFVSCSLTSSSSLHECCASQCWPQWFQKYLNVSLPPFRCRSFLSLAKTLHQTKCLNIWYYSISLVRSAFVLHKKRRTSQSVGLTRTLLNMASMSKTIRFCLN